MIGRREKVFVSYSSKNDRFVRDEVLPQIQRAKREHWFAPRSIGGGDDWRMKLLDGLDNCDRLLVVVSREAQKSPYVHLELASATKKLLVKQAKLDARKVHRAILPVKIDERGPHGEKTGAASLHKKSESDGKASEAEVDPYLIHPYLTLVNFIAVPNNDELNKLLCPKTGEYLGDTKKLTRDQKRSIRAYLDERTEARKRLQTAIRNPDALRWGFKRFGRLMDMLTHASVQRVGIAAVLFLALSALVVGGPAVARTLRERGWDAGLLAQSVTTIPRLDITADQASLETDPIAPGEGIPINMNDGPVRLLVSMTTADGLDASTYVTLRPEISEDEVATGDPRATPPSELPPLARPIETLPLEAPVIMVSADSMRTWQDVASTNVRLRQEPVQLHIRATANGRETMTPLTLPSLPGTAAPPPLETPTITVSADAMESWQEPANARIRVQDEAVQLHIRSVANGREVTTPMTITPTPTSTSTETPYLESPTIAVSADSMQTWQEPANARIRLERDPLRLYIRSTANGRETTTPVTITPPAAPPAVTPDIHLMAHSRTRDGGFQSESPQTAAPDVPADFIPEFSFSDPTILEITSVANGMEVTRKLRLAPSHEAPRIEVMSASMESWQPAEHAQIQLADRAMPLNILATANGQQSTTRVMLPAQRPPSAPEISMRWGEVQNGQLRWAEFPLADPTLMEKQWMAIQRGGARDDLMPPGYVRNPLTFLQITSAVDGMTTNRFIRVRPAPTEGAGRVPPSRPASPPRRGTPDILGEIGKIVTDHLSEGEGEGKGKGKGRLQLLDQVAGYVIPPGRDDGVDCTFQVWGFGNEPVLVKVLNYEMRMNDDETVTVRWPGGRCDCFQEGENDFYCCDGELVFHVGSR